MYFAHYTWHTLLPSDRQERDVNTTLSAPMMSSGVSPPPFALIALTKPWKAGWDLGTERKLVNC